MENIEDWLLTISIVYVLNEKPISKGSIYGIVNHFYKIGIPDVIIIDEFGNNSDLSTNNRYFRYFPKNSLASINNIISEPDRYGCMNNIVVISNNKVYYHSRYINIDYMNKLVSYINENFQDISMLVDSN